MFPQVSGVNFDMFFLTFTLPKGKVLQVGEAFHGFRQLLVYVSFGQWQHTGTADYFAASCNRAKT